MGAYSYTALKESGRENKGIIEGNSPRHIRQLLREKGLTPLTIEEITSESPQHKQSFHLLKRKSAVLTWHYLPDNWLPW